MGFTPDAGLFLRLSKYNLYKSKGKIIWLQHGVIGNYLQYVNPHDTRISLLITSSKEERNFLIEKNGYDKNIVKCTGLARFDNLEKKESKRILFMPTHRIYLHNMSDKEFIKTDYYKNINGLLNNKKLNSLLNDNNLTLVLYVHSEFQKYSHLFITECNKIKIDNIDNYDVQELLINSCLLITDYSSVHFDYAYMEKPVIYYQFDYDDFRKGHYEEGYFSYMKDGFGKVCKNEMEVISPLKYN